MMYATQKTSIDAALSTAKAFACTSCSHKPGTPSPAYPDQKQLDARMLVRRIEVKPKIRPASSHMFCISLLIPLLFTPATL